MSTFGQIRDQYGFAAECTPMDELRVAFPVRLVGTQYSGSTLDANFWSNTVANGGTAAVASSQLTLRTNTTANGSALVQSLRTARYIGGASLRYRAVIRQSSTGAANNIRRWGAFTATDGVFFELNGTTLNIVTRKASSDTAVAAASWNGATYAMTTDATTYEIYWTNSKVYFIIGGILRHTVSAATATYSDALSLPVRAENTNSGGGTTDISMEVRTHTVYRLGHERSAPIYARQSGTTAGVVLKYGPGNLHGAIVSNVSNTASVTIYDNTAASGTIIWTSGAMGNNTVPFALDFHDVPFSTGLTLVIAGANCDVTLICE